MGGAEEGFVAAAGVGGVGAEGGGAVVEGHHAAFLAHAVGVGDEVRVLLEGARGGVGCKSTMRLCDRKNVLKYFFGCTPHHLQPAEPQRGKWGK